MKTDRFALTNRETKWRPGRAPVWKKRKKNYNFRSGSDTDCSECGRWIKLVKVGPVRFVCFWFVVCVVLVEVILWNISCPSCPSGLCGPWLFHLKVSYSVFSDWPILRMSGCAYKVPWGLILKKHSRRSWRACVCQIIKRPCTAACSSLVKSISDWLMETQAQANLQMKSKCAVRHPKLSSLRSIAASAVWPKWRHTRHPPDVDKWWSSNDTASTFWSSSQRQWELSVIGQSGQSGQNGQAGGQVVVINNKSHDRLDAGPQDEVHACVSYAPWPD